MCTETATYSIKTFNGAQVATLVDRAAHPALKKADANGESTNEIGWRVQGNKVSCMLNGAEATTFRKTEDAASGLARSKP